MSGKKKQRFYAMAEGDKKRYDVEMATFMKTEAGKESRKKAKLTKDPNAPKRPLSAFFLYCKDERAKVKARMENVRVIEVNKELARRWSECTEDQKFKYEVLSAIDKARYEKVSVLLLVLSKFIAQLILSHLLCRRLRATRRRRRRRASRPRRRRTRWRTRTRTRRTKMIMMRRCPGIYFQSHYIKVISITQHTHTLHIS